MSYYTIKKKHLAVCAKMKKWRDAKERKRIQRALENPTVRPRDEGDYIGFIDIRLNDEPVRRFVLRQGPRRNNLLVQARGKTMVAGWDWLFSKLRKHLAPVTRQIVT